MYAGKDDFSEAIPGWSEGQLAWYIGVIGDTWGYRGCIEIMEKKMGKKLFRVQR